MLTFCNEGRERLNHVVRQSKDYDLGGLGQRVYTGDI
jgi:hypothetical protein